MQQMISFSVDGTEIIDMSLLPAAKIVVQENSRVAIFFNQTRIVQQSIHYQIDLECNAQATLVWLFLHSAPSVHIKINLNKSGAKVHATGLYVLDADQSVNIHTGQYHYASNTSSDLLFKGVLSGAAYANYQGMIEINHHISEVHAVQNNKNIMLGELVQVVSSPHMQVNTNHVRCVHGSAIGVIDDQQLHYLQSRGIDRKKSIYLLMKSFCADIFDMLDESYVNRSKIDKKIVKMAADSA